MENDGKESEILMQDNKKSPLPQGKGEPLQTTCILSYAPKITDGHRRGLLLVRPAARE